MIFMYLLSGLTVDRHTKEVKKYVGHSFMAIDDLKFIAYISIINEKKKTELLLNMKVRWLTFLQHCGIST